MKLYLPTKLRPMDTYGTSRYIEMLADVMPDVVVMLNDPYVVLKHIFRNKFDEELLLARTRPIIAYLPVDGTNQPAHWSNLPGLVSAVPPVTGGTGQRLIPVAMSKFGQDFLGGPLAYHGVEHDRFRPVSAKDPITMPDGTVIKSKGDAKEAFGFERDSFLVLRVDRNSHRKNFGDTWRALVPVMKRHKNVVAWFHCLAEGDQLELPQLFSRDMDTAQRFFYPAQFNTHQGWPEDALIALYNAADVFVSTSWGEGFGFSLAEAAACGVPIVAQNVSSIPEVVGPGGILLEPERLTAVESGQDQWLPDVGAFTDAIERLYMSSGMRRSLGEAGRQHVVDSFSWDETARVFHELITDAQKDSVPSDPHGDEDAEPEPAAVGAA
jgi:glycosyltransferase involved in cell wall biosynthesis